MSEWEVAQDILYSGITIVQDREANVFIVLIGPLSQATITKKTQPQNDIF